MLYIYIYIYIYTHYFFLLMQNSRASVSHKNKCMIKCVAVFDWKLKVRLIQKENLYI